MKYDKKYIGKRYIELFPLTGGGGGVGNGNYNNSNRSDFGSSNKRLKNFNDYKSSPSSGPSLSLSSSYYNTYSSKII